jgi:hypothetical protein
MELPSRIRSISLGLSRSSAGTTTMTGPGASDAGFITEAMPPGAVRTRPVGAPGTPPVRPRYAPWAPYR